MQTPVLKVSAKSPVKSVARSITKALEESGTSVEIQVIGAGALNQAIKAVTIARGFVANKGRDLVVRPGFGETEIDGETLTQIKLFVSVI